MSGTKAAVHGQWGGRNIYGFGRNGYGQTEPDQWLVALAFLVTRMLGCCSREGDGHSTLARVVQAASPDCFMGTAPGSRPWVPK